MLTSRRPSRPCTRMPAVRGNLQRKPCTLRLLRIITPLFVTSAEMQSRLRSSAPFLLSKAGINPQMYGVSNTVLDGPVRAISQGVEIVRMRMSDMTLLKEKHYG